MAKERESWETIGAMLVAGAACLTAAAPSARADMNDVGCKGCVVVGESTTEPRPLVVLLHGDDGDAQKLLAAWKAAAKEKNVTLYAPKCPRDQGCTAGSWWKWSGAPTWVEDRVADVEAKIKIDPDRRYLAGWSGGATWATMHADLLPATFAALSIVGGGSPGAACSPIVSNAGKACSPIHYLTGTKNPLHHLATQARDKLVSCGFDVTWDEREGLDHAGEWKAYTKDVPAILDKLLAASRTTCKGPPTSDEPEPPPPPAPPAATSEPPPPAPAPVPPKKGCACRVGDADGAPSAPLAVVSILGVALALTRRFVRRAGARADAR